MNNTLHVCWLVDPWKVSRDQYLKAWQAAGWHCVLWHSGQVLEPPLEGVELRHADEVVVGSVIEEIYRYELRHHSHASCADLFRYLVLQKFGGSYADLDVLPGKNARPTLPDGPLFGESSICTFEIRFMRMPAGHPLVGRILDRVRQNEEVFVRGGGYIHGYRSVVDRTGPNAAFKVVARYAAELGETVNGYLLGKATIDFTPENTGEHHFGRMPEILRLARRPLHSRFRSQWHGRVV